MKERNEMVQPIDEFFENLFPFSRDLPPIPHEESLSAVAIDYARRQRELFECRVRGRIAKAMLQNFMSCFVKERNNAHDL